MRCFLIPIPIGMSPDDIDKMMADAMGASLFGGVGRTFSNTGRKKFQFICMKKSIEVVMPVLYELLFMFLAEPAPESYVPGWKTQGGKVSANSTINLENNGFYGLGPCPATKVAYADLQKASSEDEIIDFYMKLLRTHCLDKEKSFIKNLIKNGVIKVDTGAKVINVNTKNPLM